MNLMEFGKPQAFLPLFLELCGLLSLLFFACLVPFSMLRVVSSASVSVSAPRFYLTLGYPGTDFSHSTLILESD